LDRCGTSDSLRKMELVLGCGLQTVCTPHSPTISPQLVPRNAPHLGNAVSPVVITNAQASQEISIAPPSSVVLINTILGTSTQATTTFPSTAPSTHTQLCVPEASQINLIFGSHFYRSSKPSSHTRTQLSVTSLLSHSFATCSRPYRPCRQSSVLPS
jgi:hypothetical protein